MNNLLIYYIIFWIIIIAVSLYYYEKIKDKELIQILIQIITASMIGLGFINYIDNSNKNKLFEISNRNKNYIDSLGKSFDEINSFYLENPKELHNLYEEFYKYNDFPDDKSIKNKQNISPIEYIYILKIINIIYIVYISNITIFEDINFKSQLFNYTRSKKLKYILALNKNNYSHEFINTLTTNQLINVNDLIIENIGIPII